MVDFEESVSRLSDAFDYHFKAGSGFEHLGRRLQTNARIETSGAGCAWGGGVGCGGGDGCGGGEITIGWPIRAVDNNSGFSRTIATAGEGERTTADAIMGVAMWATAAAGGAAPAAIGVPAAGVTTALIITAGRATVGAGGTRNATGLAATTALSVGALPPAPGCATNSRR